MPRDFAFWGVLIAIPTVVMAFIGPLAVSDPEIDGLIVLSLLGLVGVVYFWWQSRNEKKRTGKK
jgi:hypothetical protein